MPIDKRINGLSDQIKYSHVQQSRNLKSSETRGLGWTERDMSENDIFLTILLLFYGLLTPFYAFSVTNTAFDLRLKWAVTGDRYKISTS